MFHLSERNIHYRVCVFMTLGGVVLSRPKLCDSFVSALSNSFRCSICSTITT